jgi:hypothetical protein
MRELTRRQSNQSKKVEIVNYSYQWQILKPSEKKKGREELHSFCQNTKWVRGESYSEKYYKNGLSPWFREIKMNRHAYVSINRMRAGHFSLEASLSRFNYTRTKGQQC